jgi:hypothetical protein
VAQHLSLRTVAARADGAVLTDTRLPARGR